MNVSPHSLLLLRAALAAGAALCIGALALAHQYVPALVLGIGAGTYFLLRGIASGGGLGNARRVGQGPADVSTRVGVCLAAAGIASASLGHDPPFPPPFRVFYGVCLALACAGVVFLAVRTARSAPP